MPGPILHLGATVLCAHGGQAMPTAPVPRVLVSGQPVATIAAPYAVAGCPFVPPAPAARASPGNGSSARCACSRMGQPVAIQTGVAVCAPTGTPLMPIVVPAARDRDVRRR